MTTIGVLGGRWRATVSGAGSIEPWDGSPVLDWFVAADDRWHVPTQEPTVRQRRIDGAPVLETRLKVPSGDAIHRVWCVADHGGMTVIEIENDSTLPFAVAFSRRDLLSARPATNVPIQGITLPDDAVVFPVGHRSTVQFALRHTAPAAGSLPSDIPTAMQVARGWTTVIDRGGRILVPDIAVVDELARLRGELVLNGPIDPDEDAVGFLLDVGALVRLGERAEPWVSDVADAAGLVARRPHAWDGAAALDAAAAVLVAAGEKRAVGDVVRLRPAESAPLPTDAPLNRALAWSELRLARAVGGGTAELLGAGMPTSWLGANFEVYDLPIGPSTRVSYAVRWHGDRPAVLWETTGPVVPLSAPSVAPDWSTAEPKGEALWPAPVGAASGSITGTDISFS